MPAIDYFYKILLLLSINFFPCLCIAIQTKKSQNSKFKIKVVLYRV